MVKIITDSTHTMSACTLTHHQMVISSASSFSSIFMRAVFRVDQDGTPFLATLSCCCSHAASISVLHLLTAPRCSNGYLFIHDSIGSPAFPGQLSRALYIWCKQQPLPSLLTDDTCDNIALRSTATLLRLLLFQFYQVWLHLFQGTYRILQTQNKVNT